ncbi:MAG: hypothetical protein QXT25_01000 [Candidatus Anstonellaceae archaeon]
MEQIFQEPQPILKKPEGPVERRRHQFGRLMDERFVDPKAEALLIVPQETYAPIVVDLTVQRQTETKMTILHQIYYYLVMLFSAIRKRLTARKRLKLTKKGREALEQLKYLADLCEATSIASQDEITSDAAFGEAYYEIMRLSYELAKMSQSEQEHHMRRYLQHFRRFVKSLQY